MCESWFNYSTSMLIPTLWHCVFLKTNSRTDACSVFIVNFNHKRICNWEPNFDTLTQSFIELLRIAFRALTKFLLVNTARQMKVRFVACVQNSVCKIFLRIYNIMRFSHSRSLSSWTTIILNGWNLRSACKILHTIQTIPGQAMILTEIGMARVTDILYLNPPHFTKEGAGQNQGDFLTHSV